MVRMVTLMVMVLGRVLLQQRIIILILVVLGTVASVVLAPSMGRALVVLLMVPKFSR